MNGQVDVSTEFARRYRIEREIGRGATATVYLARDTTRGESVALKILRPELIGTSTVRQFLREISNLSVLDHPHILNILGTGEYENQLYIVLPYMREGTLRHRLTLEKQLAIKDAVAIAATIAEALEYAHRQGLIHRDIKPENILFADGLPSIADFGIARALETAVGDTLTSSGIIRGTPAFMSPEQASGDRDLDGRSDVFSLGCVLYEMVAGVPAFIGPTIGSVIAQRFVHPPRDVRVYRPTTPSPLAAIIAKALAIMPADRFASAGELAQALRAQALADGWDTSDGTPSIWRRMTSWRAAIAVAATAAAAGAGVLAMRSRSPVGDRFRERDWILVSDFDGPTDDPQFAATVRELTTVGLNQSRFVSTLPRSQLSAAMRLAGIADTTTVGPQLARELAYRSAVRAVLVGSIKHLGTSNYSIVMHVIDADDGADILSVAGAAHDTLLVATVEKLAREIRSGLGERKESIEATRPLLEVATASFPAYRLYVEGARLQSRGDGKGSTRLLREAIALDSGFASAWFTMAWNYMNEHMTDSARWAFGEAQRRRNRLSDLQRYRLEADIAYTLDYDVAAAIRSYDLYIAESPRAWAVYNNRGSYLIALGRYEDALDSFEHAVAAYPLGHRGAQILVMNKAATEITLGRVADAEQTMRDLTGPFATYMRLMRDAATDQWRDADSVAMSAATAPSSPGWLRPQATAIAASSRAVRGAVGSADELFARAQSSAPPDIKRWYQRARLLLAVASGRSAPPLPNELVTDTTAPGRLTIALAYAVGADTALARVALSAVNNSPPNTLRRLGFGPTLVQSWIDDDAQNWKLAARRIGAAAIEGENDTALLDRVGSLSLRWLAAEAYARSGQPDSATIFLELAIKPIRMPGNEYALRGLVLPFAHRRLAQWYTTLGRRTEAVRHWRAFLTTFTDPDPDLTPFVAEAQAALARLNAA